MCYNRALVIFIVVGRWSPFTITDSLMSIYCRRQLYCGLRIVILVSFLRRLLLLPAYESLL
jgi:hypothetical protein